MSAPGDGPGGGFVVRCPAKINPVLRVLGRRPDGFHDLDLTFVSLELHDRLAMSRAEAFSLDVVAEAGEAVPVAGNLVLQAAELLQDRLGRGQVPGARLRLEKRIPAAAGLGGGSSDAAGALLGLLRLWGADVPAETLAEWALSLGSDVPYFLRGGHQRGRSRGELLTPMPEGPQERVLLVHPRMPLATSLVFALHAAGPRTTLTSRKTRTSFDPEAPAVGSDGVLSNDLWWAALQAEPVLAEIYGEVCGAFPEARVGLSGSGPTFFVLVPGEMGEKEVTQRADRLHREDVDLLLTRTMDADELQRSRFELPGAPPGEP